MFSLLKGKFKELFFFTVLISLCPLFKLQAPCVLRRVLIVNLFTECVLSAKHKTKSKCQPVQNSTITEI